jgi:hypothetical protein
MLCKLGDRVVAEKDSGALGSPDEASITPKMHIKTMETPPKIRLRSDTPSS